MTATSIAFASLTGGCGGSAGAPSPVPSSAVTSPEPSPSPSTGPAALVELVLRVTTEGGFVARPCISPSCRRSWSTPTEAILTPAPVPAIYPGPLLPVELVRNVGAAGIAAIRAAITTAGLDVGAGRARAIGAGCCRHGLCSPGRRSDRDHPLSRPRRRARPGRPGRRGPSTDPGRAAAQAPWARLADPSDTWGGQPSAAVPYVPTSLPHLRRARRSGGIRLTTPQHPVAWPLTPPLASFGTPAQPDRGISGLRVGVVSVADAASSAPA